MDTPDEAERSLSVVEEESSLFPAGAFDPAPEVTAGDISKTLVECNRSGLGA